ncbi:AcrR family transcriptional regulator [Microbacterium terrae]|uniref:HTH-type transcriptional regulator BetI n=1 Tax=Microbacterium terrae TaxID=69369 RepID=A0A0M2H256_9MICO|nr:TetR/AcrR family transcriptional regulator [Microbacterium terrae]KJL37534.1 HTH-type transcriptional regulator BetI [Microbacterium terrae]MBP1076363.1 AcrR family transcriptional regulator [Microbacterium terrae]GLJ97187.1 TetR family transcriptional regulator [Microbacterium terrae]
MTTHVSAQPKPRRVRMATSARREQIIAVATTLIADRGFWGVTLREVAIACGISEPGILHHVGSKDGLLVAVLEHRDHCDRKALAGRLGVAVSDLDADPAPFGLREMCTAAVERNATQPEIVRLYTVLQAESLSETHPAFSYFGRREQLALDLFSRAARTSGVPAAKISAVARETLSAMNGLQLAWLRSDQEFDFVDAWEAFADRFLPAD